MDKPKTELCPCKDKVHSYSGICNARISPDFKTCYFCYKGHIREDTDNDPLTGTDENDLSRRHEAQEEQAKFNELE